MAPFVFRLQPLLEKALSERDGCQQELIRLRLRQREEHQKLEQRKEELTRVKQQIAADDDHWSGACGAMEMLEHLRWVEALRLEEVRRVERLGQQSKALKVVLMSVREKASELDEKIGQVKALERMREQAMKEHQAGIERVMEERREDAALQAWGRDQSQPS